MRPFRCALAVESETLDLGALTEAMGREPDKGLQRGEMIVRSSVRRSFSGWQVVLDLPDDVHPGTEGLTQAIEKPDAATALRVRALVERGCSAVISVAQELTDDTSTHGLHLSAAAIQWIASAQAGLDVDQYVKTVDLD